MSKNQKIGLVMVGISIILLSLPVIIFGIPSPFKIGFPLALLSMPILIVGFCLIAKVFDYEEIETENQ